MFDDTALPLFGRLDTDPDSIPRGFIHRDPDILSVFQQNTLSEAKIKMLDFNEEYLAKHPQVEALVRLLISELITHKPYYVRDFIKEILSLDDLETRVAKIIASKGLNMNRRHTRNYFSHTQAWQDKAAGKGDPEPVKEKPTWPDPRPFRVETRRDKREYCHPHYFKLPFVFYPREYMAVKVPDFGKKKDLRFHSKSYAKLVLENFKDIWGDPVTNIPPRIHEEEVYSAYSIFRKKTPEDMTNKELIKTCMRCRRLNLRNYLYAINKRQFNEPKKPYVPSHLLAYHSLQLRTANKLLEKTIETIRKGKTTNVNLKMDRNNIIKNSNPNLKEFQSRFIPHVPLADLDTFQSPIPGLSFKEKGDLSEYLPLADMKPTCDMGRMAGNRGSEITIHTALKKYPEVTHVIVPTKDLEGDIVDESVLAHRVLPSICIVKEKEVQPSELITEDKRPDSECRSMPLSSSYDEKSFLLDRKQRTTQNPPKSVNFQCERDSEITISSTKVTSPRIEKRVPVVDLEGNVCDSFISMVLTSKNIAKTNEDQILPEGSGSGMEIHDIQKSIGTKDIIHSYQSKSEESLIGVPPYFMEPYLQINIDPQQLEDFLQEKEEQEEPPREPLRLDMSDVKRYI